MTRPKTRGDIFRQQAIRCARAVFAAARDEAAARRRPLRPNRTSSSFGVGLRECCDFTPAPPNRRFSCRAPPPHRSAPCPRLRSSWASAPGRRWRSSPRRSGRPPAGRRAGSRRALPSPRAGWSSSRSPSCDRRRGPRTRAPSATAGARWRASDVSAEGARTSSTRPCSPRRCGRSGARTAAARGGCTALGVRARETSGRRSVSTSRANSAVLIPKNHL